MSRPCFSLILTFTSSPHFDVQTMCLVAYSRVWDMSHLFSVSLILLHVCHAIRCQCLPLGPRSPAVAPTASIGGSGNDSRASAGQEDATRAGKGFMIIDFDIAVPVQVSGGTATQRLPILLSPQQQQQQHQNTSSSSQSLWSGGQIPFLFHSCKPLLCLLLSNRSCAPS